MYRNIRDKRRLLALAKGLVGVAVLWFTLFAYHTATYAQIGDMGFFGGISEGRRLPRTTEQLLAQTSRSNARNTKDTFRYSELVFLSGRPVQFNGLIDITVNGRVAENTQVGSFTVNYRVYPSTGSDPGDVVINRTANFTVNYRVEGKQVIYDYDIINTSWRETIAMGGTTYTLDYRVSRYGTSIIEDRTPGVSYYRGDVSGYCVYTVSGGGGTISMESAGSFYGCASAWSSTETHRTDISLFNDEWALTYQIRPSVTVNKILQYTQNEPTAMSFEGNYREVTQTVSGLKYDIFIKPDFMWDALPSGTISLPSVNTFEQLPAADLAFLKGNAAEDDIRRLFAMQILTGQPKDYQPGQAITRGQFVTALVRAIKLPIEQPTTRTTGRNQPVTTYIFSDVDSTRPEYPYILAAYQSEVAFGRDNGMFYFDYPIERQEAYTIMIKALGLSQLGLDPTPMTVFTDDAQIAAWAKRELSVANRIGLIAPDADGKIYPTRNISKGEAAALLNSLVEFLRTGLTSDFADQIVNIVR